MPKVYLVGARLGDVELLTLKVYRHIRCADAILYDRLVSPEVLSLAKLDCELVYVGKEDGKHTLPQEKINLLLLQYAHKVVLGISFAIAVPAIAGIPVTHRGLSSSFAVITVHEDPRKENFQQKLITTNLQR